MYKLHLNLIGLFFILLLFTPNQTVAQQKFSYPMTVLPKDTSKLWVSDGDMEKEKVLILLQGGPKGDLNFVKRDSVSSWRFLPNYENYFRVHLHQSSTYNPEMFEYKDEFSLEMAKKEVDNSSEMLLRAIKYFKDRGKTVYVLGHSFGAFIIPYYLSTRPSLADKYIAISGRIDDDPIGVETHKQGYNGVYMAEGVRMVADNEENIQDYSEGKKKYYRVKQLLKWAIGVPRYSQELKEKDLSNLTYIYYLDNGTLSFFRFKNTSLGDFPPSNSLINRVEIDEQILSKAQKKQVSFFKFTIIGYHFFQIKLALKRLYKRLKYSNINQKSLFFTQNLSKKISCLSY